MWFCRISWLNLAVPSLCDCGILDRALRHEKTLQLALPAPAFGLLSSGFPCRRKPGGPPRRVVVNRDPFRHSRFRETLKLRRPSSGCRESPIRYCQVKLFGRIFVSFYHLQVIDSRSQL